MSSDATDDCSDREDATYNVLRWEIENRARTFLEGGYVDYPRKGLPVNVDVGPYSSRLLGVYGSNGSPYRCLPSNELPEEEVGPGLFPKARSYDRDGYGTYITASQLKDLYSAVEFANLGGVILNVFVDINWGQLGISDHVEAAGVFRRDFMRQLQQWHDYKFPYWHPLASLYVHEVGKKQGFHTHLMLGIRIEKRAEFPKWAARRIRSLSRVGDIPDTAYHIRFADSDPIERQWRRFQYLLKGADPRAKLPCKLGTAPYARIQRLIGAPAQSPGFILCEKRVGVSNNIGTVARKGFGFISLVEKGFLDVRILYSGTAYFQFLWFFKIRADPKLAHWLKQNMETANAIITTERSVREFNANERKRKKRIIDTETRELRRALTEERERLARLSLGLKT